MNYKTYPQYNISLPLPLHLTAKSLLPYLRVPVILLSLVMILYFTFYFTLYIPYENTGFAIRWQPDNTMKVVYVDEVMGQVLALEDRVVQIDDNVLSYRDPWQPLYQPGQSTYTLLIQRGEQMLPIDVSVPPPSFAGVLNRLKTGLVAFLIWLVATPIILLATYKNREAWYVGLLFMSLAMLLSAAEASLFNVPGALILVALLPVLAVAFTELACRFSNRSLSVSTRRVIQVMYMVATVVAIRQAADVILFFPRGLTLSTLTGLPLDKISILVTGVGLIGNPIILAVRFWRMEPSYQRRQIQVIMIFMGLAIFPLVFLALVPGIVLGGSLIPAWAATILLSLIPVGYGFAIYRRNYLELELFVTRTLTLLTLGLFMVLIYFVLFYILDTFFVSSQVSSLAGLLTLLPTLAIAWAAGRPTRRIVQTVIYGPHVPYEDYLAQFNTALSKDPQIRTLQMVMVEAADLLQVRRAVLLLANHRQQMEGVAHLRAEPVTPIPFQPEHFPVQKAMLRAEWVMKEWGFLATMPSWVELVVPLWVRGKPVGMLWLGAPMPDGYFHALQMGFVVRLANMLGVASEVVQLLASSLKMSGELLQVQEAERFQLASQIHDEPLQQIALVTNQLNILSQEPTLAVSDLLPDLQAQKQSLRLVSKQLRDICAGLRPPVLQQGIEWVVKEVVYTFQESSLLPVTLTVTVPDELWLDEQMTLVIYRVLLESLNNVRKHAQATQVWVTLTRQAEQLTLSVEDDGQGTTLNTLSLPELIRLHHFGIVGMHEWATLVQGTLQLRERPLGGTIVTLDVPL